MPKSPQTSTTWASSREGDDRELDHDNLIERQIPSKGSITTSKRIRKPKDQHKKRGTKEMSLIEYRNQTEQKIAALQKEIALLEADNDGNKKAREIFKLKKIIHARKHRLSVKEKAEE